eukprot:CAMPEP_0119484608 /NCGR_PEP_ID=MMETSP1344-20130328/11570_1 /TAXON_ID=236787 /ORGANISM="Florenciella parvula, Strain CCMP2471" /LENGTH=109 /DNA_ID=CAMNT_0007519207 /DNA_START=3 /DNA_END=329 /DNA_ORIENTATION=+
MTDFGGSLRSPRRGAADDAAASATSAAAPLRTPLSAPGRTSAYRTPGSELGNRRTLEATLAAAANLNANLNHAMVERGPSEMPWSSSPLYDAGGCAAAVARGAGAATGP